MKRYKIHINTCPAIHIYAYNEEGAINRAITVHEYTHGPDREPVNSVKIEYAGD